MKAFICALFACLLSVQALPRPTLDVLGVGQGVLATATGLTADVSAGLGPNVFLSACLKAFGGAGATVPTSFLDTFKTAFANPSADGSIPCDQFNSAFNGVSGDGFPFNVINSILGGVTGGSGFGTGFTQTFGSEGAIPANVANEFKGVLDKDDVTTDEFTAALKAAYAATGNTSGDVSPSTAGGALDGNQNTLAQQLNQQKQLCFGSQ